MDEGNEQKSMNFLFMVKKSPEGEFDFLFNNEGIPEAEIGWIMEIMEGRLKSRFNSEFPKGN